MTKFIAGVLLGAVRASVKALTVVLLVLTLGLHWAVLQTIAWAGMAMAYSARAGLRQGLVMTFDGQHPCPLCKAIERGRAEEKEHRDQSIKPGGKLDPVPICSAETFVFWQPRAPLPPHCVWLPERTEPPPKPRPRPSLV